MKRPCLRKFAVVCIAVLGGVLSAKGAPLVIEDFEGVAVGTKWKMRTPWGDADASTATATVVADPANSKNHVLKVTISNWNTFPAFDVPAEYRGAKILERFRTLRFRLYRPSGDTNDYKQVHIYYGGDAMYQDNSYPYQGDRASWQQRTYELGNVSAGSSATELYFGIHCDVSEYYIDDVMLYGEFDDFITYESQELDICSKNTSSSYATHTQPTYIPAGMHLNLYTSRYTDVNAPFAGPGTLNIYSGGERTYLGEHSSKKYPSWAAFTGDVYIYPYKKVEAGAGFYGVVMATNGKTFSPEDIDNGISEGKACNMLAENRVFLHDGAAIAFENGTRAAIYGELNTEAGSRIYGYYKATAGTGAYLIVGGKNTDATLAGRIAPMESGGKPLATSLVGLIKDGTGTYTLTANDNCISGAIRVRNGRVNICNDAAAAEKGKLSGGTGTPTGSAAVAYVLGKGVLGGTGNIAGTVDVYGTVEPGTTETGTLRLKDYAANATAMLRMHPEGTLRFKIKSASEYDKLLVSSYIMLSKIKEDFTESTDAPRIKVALTDDCNVQVGDEFTILTASQRLNADNWKWDIVFPTRYTWKAEERRNSDGTYALMLTVTSLEDDPGNQGGGDDDPGNTGEEEELPESFADDGSGNTLRKLADEKGLRIGVAVPVSRINIGDTSDANRQIVTSEFNMVVAENEMKFDWIEPAQNSFNYGDGDKLCIVAKGNKMQVRGHTLAWHSQVAEWVSVDGKKNDKGWSKQQLMDILKNHIMNVVGHYKGKVTEWDVANEVLDDDQSIVRNNPNGYQLRKQSIWTTVCGEEFIDSAFVWAHRADPNAKLYLNDYGNETLGNAKAQAFYNLAKRLKASNIPIDGVGFQCHMDAGRVNATAISKNLARYEPLGLECCITELDLGIDSNTPENLQLQARDYYRVVKAAMELPHCRSVLVWGISDNMSWRMSNPLLWNSGLQKKDAYYGVRMALDAFTPVIPGDVDGDGTITMSDANMVVNHYLGVPVSGFNEKAADINGDGIISMSDANAIVNMYLSL